MALLSFVDSAPRAYRLKAGNAYLTFSTAVGTFPVILWGVDCRNDPSLGDVPTGPVQIQNPARFKSRLEQATTGLTVPPHEGVRHHAIPEGFVVTLIPSGMHAPYQMVGDLSYYMRSGSNFAKTPHAVLAGLFGRRPQPVIKHHFFIPSTPSIIEPGVVMTQISVMLRNYGRGIAEDVFINLSIRTHPGGRCEILFKLSEEKELWWGRLVRSQQMQMITRAGFRLPPEADLMPLSLEIRLQNPIERDFEFEAMCGCAGAEPWRFEFKCEIEDIVEASDRLLGTPPDAPDAETLGRRFNRILYKQIPNS
jgi:hypothetical protein